MIEMDSIVSSWPGKSAGPEGISHPAIYHMLDVAAVAEVLIRPWGFSSDLHDAVILLTALHDLGKISNSFRAMLTEGTRQGRRHWEMTEVLDRKSTRLNSSHVAISYAVFCL